MNLLERTDYLNWLLKWKDHQIIKVVTGVRRCGKSTLFEIYQNYLLQNGVSQSQIIAANFEDVEFEDLLYYKDLYQYIRERLIPDKKIIFFSMKFSTLRAMKRQSTACFCGIIVMSILQAPMPILCLVSLHHC